MTLRLIKIGAREKIPNTPVRNFDFSNHQTDPIQLSNDMQLLTHEFKLVGVCAPQVGYDLNVIYILGMESALFNARVVEESSTQVYMEEVSGSCPDLIVKIKRPETIRVRYANAIGDMKTEIFSGITARTILRKMDMIKGINLLQRANRFHRDQALKRMKYSLKSVD